MKTLELVPGTRIEMPQMLNASAFTATVERVEPWILTGGRNAGKQAMDKGKPLFTVRMTDVIRTAPALRPSTVDEYCDALPTRNYSAPADKEWTVAS